MKNNKINWEKLFSNPLIVTIIAIISLIIILAIFKSSSKYFGVGFGINAHIGDLKGDFSIEAFDNEESTTEEDRHNSEEYNQLSERNDYTSSQPAFVMYYANWCGNCKTTKPVFNKLIESYEGFVNIMMIDCELDKHQDLIKSQNIRGYPTIRYYQHGINASYLEYTGERDYNSFVNYLNTKINNSYENYNNKQKNTPPLNNQITGSIESSILNM